MPKKLKIVIPIIIFLALSFVSYVYPRGQQVTEDIFGINKTLCADGKDTKYLYGLPLQTHGLYYYVGSCTIFVSGNEIYFKNIVVNEVIIGTLVVVYLLKRKKI